MQIRNPGQTIIWSIFSSKGETQGEDCCFFKMQVQVYPPHMYMSLLLLHACAALLCYTAFLLDLRSVLRLSDRVVHVLFGG